MSSLSRCVFPTDLWINISHRKFVSEMLSCSAKSTVSAKSEQLLMSISMACSSFPTFARR